MVSPGLSSVPAKSEPIITDVAPAAIALVRSPENLMPPSAMTGMPGSAAARWPVRVRRGLRTACAGHDARGADAARADADFDCIRAALDERQRPFGGGHVSDHQLDLGEALAERARGVEHAAAVRVRRVEH